MAKLKYGDPILVIWGDAHFGNEAVISLDTAQKMKPLYQKSFGFFVCKDKTSLVIGMTICDSDGGTIDGTLLIPSPWIITIQKLSSE